MDSLIKTLPAILKASKNAEEVTEAACITAWNHAVGEALRANAVAKGFAAGRLEVAVVDAIWKAQLDSLRTPMLFRLNSLLGGPVVRHIDVVVEPEVFRKSNQEIAARVTDYAIPLELVSAAAEIPDPQLRRAFLGAAVSCVKRVEN